MYDLFILKCSFAYAIVMRVYRHWYKQNNEIHVETYLPEGIKFMLSMLFIYLFIYTTMAFFEGIEMVTKFLTGY